MKAIFKYYREKYNSGLFGHDGEEQESDKVNVSNSIIDFVIKGMYRPKGRKIEYNFAAIDADVLGNIYEQYLAFILKDTPKKTKLEGGRTHRKEQGIYYTPTYVVDYIVKNTVDEYTKNKDIDEILHIKILDPACGSGSFLIKAFSEICKVIDEKLKKGERIRKSNTLNDYSGRLTLQQKITILTSCIYGVDLDKKAVEISQLNLLLKLLEGETAESLANIKQTKRLLPMLNENIKNGNSLIDDIEIDKEHAFKWEEEFKEILKYDEKGNLKEGYGFDIIIGNPPYFNLQTIKDGKQKKFFEKSYRTYRGKADILYIFIEKIKGILKENGITGLIVANYFLRSHYADSLREFISSNYKIKRIIDFGSTKVFQDANVERSNMKNDRIIDGILPKEDKIIDFLRGSNNPKDMINDNYRFLLDNQISKNKSPWKFGKMEFKDTVPLSKICNIGKGVATGNDNIFVIEKQLANKLKLEKEMLDELVEDSSIDRYNFKLSSKVLIKTKKGVDINEYPILREYLEQNKSKLQKRYAVQKEGLKWFEIVRYNEDLFSNNINEQIYVYYRSVHNKFAYSNKRFIILTTTFVLTLNEKNLADLRYLTGILNSKAMENYSRKNAKKMGSCFEYSSNFIGSFPIKIVSESEQRKIIQLVNKMLPAKEKLNELCDKKTEERLRIEKEIKEIDEQIDQEVYKLYGITKEEQKIIEESLK